MALVGIGLPDQGDVMQVGSLRRVSRRLAAVLILVFVLVCRAQAQPVSGPVGSRRVPGRRKSIGFR